LDKDFLKFISRLAVIFAFVVIALGAFTRLIDAGLGCPDWPGCYGHLLPVNGSHFVAYKAWAEMIHRYCVAALSTLIVIIIVTIFSRKNLRRRHNIILSLLLIALLIYQILLGRWTVTLTLWPIIVTQHLLGGFLLVSLLWIVYLYHSPQKNSQTTHKYLPFFAVLGLILIFLQIILGAWTSTNYASLSCPDFPLCMNHHVMVWHVRDAFHLMPQGMNYEGGVLSEPIRQTIQMAHRFGALIVSVYLFMFIAIGLHRLEFSNKNTLYFYFIAALLILQICLGMMNVVFQLPVLTAVLHTVIAAALLLTLVTIVFRLGEK